MTKIFISCAETDAEIAGRIYKYLKQKAGLEPWMDNRDIPLGGKKSYELSKAIEESDYFLALLSKKALDEEGILHKQLHFAIEKGLENPENKIFIIPIRLDKCKVENEFLRDRKPLDLFRSPKDGLDKLYKVLTRESESEEKDAPILNISSELSPKLSEHSKPEPSELPELAESSEPNQPSKFVKRFIATLGLALILLSAAYLIFGPFHFHKHEADKHLEAAETYLNQGMFREALQEYGQALQICPDCPKARAGEKKANIFKQMEERDDNPGAMLTRLKTFPADDPHILMLTGNLERRMGNYAKAETLYLRALEKEPALAEAYFSLGVLYQTRNQTPKALAMFQNAVDIVPSSFKYMNNLAWTCFENGQNERAIDEYSKLLAADTNFLSAYLDVAKVLLMSQKPKQALSTYRTLKRKIQDESIVKRPNNTAAWYYPLKGAPPVVLDSLPSKRYYAFLSLAVSEFLFGMEAHTLPLIRNAMALPVEPSHAGRIAMRIDEDLSDILKIYPEMQARGEKFRRRFLTKP